MKRLHRPWPSFLPFPRKECRSESYRRQRLEYWALLHSCGRQRHADAAAVLMIDDIAKVYRLQKPGWNRRYVCVARCPNCRKLVLIKKAADLPPEWWMDKTAEAGWWEDSGYWSMFAPHKRFKLQKTTHSGWLCKR